MKPIKLSICIISLANRNAQLNELVALLTGQPRFDECEIVVLIDGGQVRPGAKRNRLVDAARGDYLACIDDDDLVAVDYVPRILEAIDFDPTVDAILIDGVCTPTIGKTVYFSYRIDGIEGEWIDNTIWRSPGHLCPIRADIARRVAFPSPLTGEDLAWSSELRPLLKTSTRASSNHLNGRMYYYRLDPAKEAPQGREVDLVDNAHQEIFTPQYTKSSGPGSTVGYSQPYRRFLENFLWGVGYEGRVPIKTIIDLGCGDMTVMGNVDLRDVDYLGFDVIADRIDQNRRLYVHRSDMMFACQDIRYATLEADLIICKDVLQHWSTLEVSTWLERLRESRRFFKYALITNCNYGPTVNVNIKTGSWRALDLTKPPFSIGEIVFSFGDAIGGYKDVVLIKGTK